MKIDTDGKPLPNDLNPQQARFCREYFHNGGCTTDAAIAAGYGHGTNRKSAGVTGSRLLTSAKCQQYLAQLRDEEIVVSDGKEPSVNELVAIFWHEARTAKSSKDRIAAAAWLGRYRAMFIDRLRNEDALDNRSEEELQAELARLQKEARKEGIVIDFPEQQGEK